MITRDWERDIFIIHPGETLKEMLEDRGISTANLADVTGYPQDYIDGIIAGTNNITDYFATDLEDKADLGSAKFWYNLQKNYDMKVLY